MIVKINVYCKTASNMLLIPLNKFHMYVLKQLVALFLTQKRYIKWKLEDKTQ